MCGIFCSISHQKPLQCSETTRSLLDARGPDISRTLSIDATSGNGTTSEATDVHIEVVSTVLALRGEQIAVQPLTSADQSFLCWNGEAWTDQGQIIGGNDSMHIFGLLNAGLLDRKANAPAPPEVRVLSLLTGIAGPYAFVFYHALSRKLFFARDPLGRRSLLLSRSLAGDWFLCSVADPDIAQGFASSWHEVTSGLHYLDLSLINPECQSLPWPGYPLSLNRSIPDEVRTLDTTDHEVVSALSFHLRASLQLRAADIPNLRFLSPGDDKLDSKIAVLFSGGLDCTLLARMIHDILPTDQPIDLINVAFHNPRVVAAASKKADNLSSYELCPDRRTGRSSYHELTQACHGRSWRFVAVDVSFEESEEHLKKIVALIAPHNTEMDISISKALYFAARGQGHVTDPITHHKQLYKSTARVLLSGLGADEIFGGYTRHATACARGGYSALLDELELDIRRLGERNLGRDDRVISDLGKEVRYPYLDESFVAWALQLPVWQKCAFRPDRGEAVSKRPRYQLGQDLPELDPAKRLLRLAAIYLGMPGVAQEKKRAIQFGARTAKMYVGRGRSKGTDLIL